jgi:hypothetical protein
MNPGRALIILGVFITLAGIFLTFGDKLPIRLGRLPGDIKVEGKDSVFYFPLATSLIVSVVLSLVMWLFNRR